MDEEVALLHTRTLVRTHSHYIGVYNNVVLPESTVDDPMSRRNTAACSITLVLVANEYRISIAKKVLQANLNRNCRKLTDSGTSLLERILYGNVTPAHAKQAR